MTTQAHTLQEMQALDLIDVVSSEYSTIRCERVRDMGEKLPTVDIAGIDSVDTDDSDEVIVALRTVQQSQVRLNVLADQKANINIGFTLLFITLSQSPVVLDSVTSGFLRWSLILITVVVAVSLTLALMVVFPRTGGTRIK